MTEKLTLQEIARVYKTTPKTFAKRVREQQIPFEPLGRQKRFDLDTVRKHLETREAAGIDTPRKRVSLPKKGGNKYAEALGV